MKILKSLDAKRWEAFLGQVPEANVYQTPEMRQVFEATMNYEPGLITLEDGGDIAALMLACIIKEGGGLKGSFSSRAIVTGGPLSKNHGVKELVQAFDKEMSPKSLYAQIRNLGDMSSFRETFQALGYGFEEHLNFVHDLTRPTAEIWAGLSDGRRKGIKKAESRGMRFIDGGREDIETFYALVQNTYEEVGIPLADRSMFDSAWRVMAPRGMARLFLAVLQDQILAGRMVLCYNGMIHDWYAGSMPTAKSQNANEFLAWSVMKWGAQGGYRLFDFGGAGKPGEKYGPGEFKRRFGGILTNYGRFQKVYHPVKHFVGRKGYEVIRRIG